MTLAQLASAAGEPAHVVRYYARRGLVQEAARDANGYRRFGEAAVQRLMFIRRAQRLGFTLDEIAEIVGDAARGRSPCPRVRALLETRLPKVAADQAEATALLAHMQRAQRRWRRLPDGAPTGTEICRLIESLQ
jgi:DNA-binding transcriptional MerR regulator